MPQRTLGPKLYPCIAALWPESAARPGEFDFVWSFSMACETSWALATFFSISAFEMAYTSRASKSNMVPLRRLSDQLPK